MFTALFFLHWNIEIPTEFIKIEFPSMCNWYIQCFLWVVDEGRLFPMNMHLNEVK